MFGEDESESPRVPSPWDALSVAASSPDLGPTTGALELKRLSEGVPKLVPEVEEGNIEYKLKLVKPSAERFMRLVTQLKWRLLEGGGQAYYELGVADSGHLVGLTANEMEESLDTLEMMAGEIGASVIVVKEIEVPALAPGIGLRIKDAVDGVCRPMKGSGSSLGYFNEIEGSATVTDPETEPTSDENVGSEDDTNPDVPHTLPRPIIKLGGHDRMRTHPERPSLQSSPALVATEVEDEIGTFTMDDLNISTVYKPLKNRGPRFQYPVPQPHEPRRPAEDRRNTKGNPGTGKAKSRRPQNPFEPPTDPQVKAQARRAKRDQRREEKRKALLVFSGLATATTDTTDEPTQAAEEDGSGSDVDITLQKARVVIEVAPVEELTSLHAAVDSKTASPAVIALDDDDDNVPRLSLEPRRMVEALVVRKLALEDAFLDFDGFSHLSI